MMHSQSRKTTLPLKAMAFVVALLAPGWLWAVAGDIPPEAGQGAGKLLFTLVMAVLLGFVLAHELPRTWPPSLRWPIGGALAAAIVWGLFWL